MCMRKETQKVSRAHRPELFPTFRPASRIGLTLLSELIRNDSQMIRVA